MMIKHMILDHLPPCSSMNPLALDVSSAGSMELRCGNKASAIKTVSSFTTNQKRPVNLELQILGFHVVLTVQVILGQIWGIQYRTPPILAGKSNFMMLSCEIPWKTNASGWVPTPKCHRSQDWYRLMELYKRYQEMSEQSIAHLWALYNLENWICRPNTWSGSNLYFTLLNWGPLFPSSSGSGQRLMGKICTWKWHSMIGIIFVLPALYQVLLLQAVQRKQKLLIIWCVVANTKLSILNFQVNHSFRRFGLVCSKLWMGVEHANHMYTMIYMIP